MNCLHFFIRLQRRLGSYEHWDRQLWAIVILLGFLGLWSLVAESIVSPSMSPASEQRTAAVTSGAFNKTLRVSGVIEALHYASIQAPKLRGPRDFGWSGLTIAKLADSGSLVDVGSVIAEFELKPLEDHIQVWLSYVAASQSNLRRKESEILVHKEIERQRLLTAQGLYEKTLLDLRSVEVRSEIESETLTGLSNAVYAIWMQHEKERRLKETVHASSLRSFSLGVKKNVLHVERHQRDYDRLRVKAPISGIVVRESLLSRAGQFVQVNEGHRIYSGTRFIRIVDLSSPMVVRASVNQVDIQAIHVGNKAIVELDAYPGLQFPAHVIAMAPIASSGKGRVRSSLSNTGVYVRHVPVRLLIESKDERILPDLSASADVQLSTDQGILIPREALWDGSGPRSTASVYVADGGKYRKRRVFVLDVNDTKALIKSDLKPGEEVLLISRPRPSVAKDLVKAHSRSTRWPHPSYSAHRANRGRLH